MVQFRPQSREIIAKIVYYGPPLGGKTTNLRALYEGYPSTVRGELVVVPTGGDRTIFFDFLPIYAGELRGMQLRVQLYTVPGQVHYNSTRQVVLRGVDGVVFVADSQRELMRNNRESWENLKDNLLLQGVTLADLPHAIQYNKRDLADIVDIGEIDQIINEYNAPFFDAIATQGIGVEETLQGIVKLVARSLRDRFRVAIEPSGVQAPPMQPAPRPAQSAEVAQVFSFAPASMPAPPRVTEPDVRGPRYEARDIFAPLPEPASPFQTSPTAVTPPADDLPAFGQTGAPSSARAAGPPAVFEPITPSSPFAPPAAEPPPAVFEPAADPFTITAPPPPAPFGEEVRLHEPPAQPEPAGPVPAAPPPAAASAAPVFGEPVAAPRPEPAWQAPPAKRLDTEATHKIRVAAIMPEVEAEARAQGGAAPPEPVAAEPLADPFDLAFDALVAPASAIPALPAGDDDVFAIAPIPEPEPAPVAEPEHAPSITAEAEVVEGEPGQPPSEVSEAAALAVQRVIPRAIAQYGEVRELELEVPVPAVWIGGKRMTLQLRLTLVPQEE
jgi:hypothetical protein